LIDLLGERDGWGKVFPWWAQREKKNLLWTPPKATRTGQTGASSVFCLCGGWASR
jgi:hypothetical protein